MQWRKRPSEIMSWGCRSSKMRSLSISRILTDGLMTWFVRRLAHHDESLSQETWTRHQKVRPLHDRAAEAFKIVRNDDEASDLRWTKRSVAILNRGPHA